MHLGSTGAPVGGVQAPSTGQAHIHRVAMVGDSLQAASCGASGAQAQAGAVKRA